MKKTRKILVKHRAAVPFADRRQEKYKRMPLDYARARHRAYGPSNYPTIYDMLPSDLTSAKGLGPSY